MGDVELVLLPKSSNWIDFISLPECTHPIAEDFSKHVLIQNEISSARAQMFEKQVHVSYPPIASGY
jgi:hypothetical protein